MTPEIQKYVQAEVTRIRCTISAGLNVLEIGSRDVNGGLRQFFQEPGDHYLGIDQEAGPGVDRVMSGHDVEQHGPFDLVLCCEVLEHDEQPWRTVHAARQVVRPGGFLLISVPFNGFPEHRYPIDMLRFLPDVMPNWFFKGWETWNVSQLLDPAGNQTLIGLARKP
jgi:SAM-dependent methyltransferase